MNNLTATKRSYQFVRPEEFDLIFAVMADLRAPTLHAAIGMVLGVDRDASVVRIAISRSFELQQRLRQAESAARDRVLALLKERASDFDQELTFQGQRTGQSIRARGDTQALLALSRWYLGRHGWVDKIGD